MAKPRSRVYHGAKAQVRRDALLHPRSRWLHYRSWAKQSGRHLRLRGATQANARRREAHEVRTGRYQPGSQAEWNGLRRMLGRGRMVVSSAPMRAMRSHRLLRQLTKSACIETFRRYGSRDYHEFRAGRALVLRLSYGGILRRPKTSRSSLASVGSTGARASRTGACKLANAASRIGGGALVRPRATMNEEQNIRAALDRHWAASDANDFETEHEIYHDDAVLEYPQSGERIRGRRNIQASRSAQPNKKRFSVRRVLGAGDLWVSEFILTYDGAPSYTVSIMEFKDNKVARETQYFGDPFEPGPSRAQWVERMS